MLRKLWIKKNYLIKLLVTIAGFLCIPLILMQLIMMEQSTVGYTKLNDDNIYEKLQLSVSSYSDLTENLRKKAMTISQDSTIRRAAKVGASEYTIYEGAQKLNEYQEETYSVGIWFHDRGFVLHNKVKVTPGEIYNQIACSKAECRQMVKSFFENDDAFAILSTADSECDHQCIIVKKRASILSLTDKDATIFFVLPEEQLEESLNERFHNCSSMAILDAQNKYIVRGADFTDALEAEADFLRFLNEPGNSNYTRNKNGSSAKIYKYVDFDSGYTCLVALQEDEAEAHLREYIDRIRVNVLVSIVLMASLLVLTIKINYKPILTLTNKHKDKTEDNDLSELELLDVAFSAVDQKVMSQEKLLSNFVIGDLLTGKTVEQKLLENCFPDLGANGSMVIALSGPVIDSYHAEKIGAILREYVNCDVYFTGVTYRPQILMVCIFSEETDVEQLKKVLPTILRNETGNEYEIRFGTVVDSVLKLRVSYLRTLTLVSERESIELDNRIADAIQRFTEDLHTGDANTIQKRLDVVELQLCALDDTNPLKQYYCYKMLSQYFSHAKEIPNAKVEMERLIVFSDTTQLFAKMRQSVRRLCSVVNDTEQETADKLKKKLLDYVDTNFNDQGLCLTSVADYLESSIYVVSRLFKEATGKGFKEYINDKRLEYARELLLTTEYTASEIAVMSGIENPVRFSSVFKAKYGLPPGQYRKLYANDSRQ